MRIQKQSLCFTTMASDVIFGLTFLCVMSLCFVQGNGTPSITRQYVSNRPYEKGDNSTFNIVCYFNLNHVPYKSPLPPPINVTLCSHILFLGSLIEDAQIVPTNPADIDMFYSKVPLMKKMKPTLKVLLTSTGNYSQVLNTQENRTRFANSVVPFLRKYGFDGLDMDWEFPTFGDIFHLPEQRHNLSLVVQEIRELFDADAKQHGGDRLLLTMAVSAGKDMITRHYEPQQLAKYVDFVNVMTYDMHMYQETFPLTGHNSPLYRGDHILDETVFRDTYFAFCANEWVRQGMNKSQVMTGIPTYSHTYTLLFKEWHEVYSVARGVGRIGDFPGYQVICEVIKNSSTTVVWDDVSKVPYLYQGALWASYDNERSVTLKTQYLLDEGFSGAMVYVLNADDYSGSCDGKTKWPLFNAINDAVKNYKNKKVWELEYSLKETLIIDIGE